MKATDLLVGITILLFVLSCSRNKLEPKGFVVSQPEQNENDVQIDGIASDTMGFRTRPGDVILTGFNRYRLTTIYKININKRTNSTFIGSNDYYSNYSEFQDNYGNHWHYHYMPGIEAVYGYNMVNISVYDLVLRQQKEFFEKPVLIKTLYYPSFLQDTLNYKPVLRNYYMVSVYDEDSNKDGFINENDLRHFYYFDMEASSKTSLIPKEYSVVSSDYDPGNDIMLINAKHDDNQNGKAENNEEMHIFWIDLKNPLNNGMMY